MSATLGSRERKEPDILYTRPKGVLLLVRALPLSGIFFFFLKSRVRSRDISSQWGRSICDFALTVSRARAHAFIIACMLTGGKLSIRRELWEIRDRINRPANSTTSPWRRRERETSQIAPAESWRHILTPKHAFPLSVERRMSSSISSKRWTIYDTGIPYSSLTVFL